MLRQKRQLKMASQCYLSYLGTYKNAYSDALANRLYLLKEGHNMRIKNRILNLLYIAISILITGYGLALALGINKGQFLILPLSYSNLSNLIPLLYFLICLIHGVFIIFTKNESKEIIVLPRFKGAVTMCPMVTLLIFHFLLFRGSFYIPGTNNLDWRNLIIHYITPALMILHWLHSKITKTATTLLRPAPHRTGSRSGRSWYQPVRPAGWRPARRGSPNYGFSATAAHCRG